MNFLGKLLANKRGSIFILATALIAAFVSLASSGTLLSIVQNDTVLLSYQMDMLQQNLIIRNEMIRSDLRIRMNADFIADRTVHIDDGDFSTFYEVQTDIAEWAVESNLRSVLQTLVTAERGAPGDKIESPIRRYSERLIQRTTLAQFQYFTDTEASENADGGEEAARVSFWGDDEFWGPVHSNDDIWIQNVGGWPTFHDSVTTAGKFMNTGTGGPLIGSGAPIDDIFLGGYREETRHWSFNPTANDIRDNGLRPFQGNEDIVYVKLNGGTFQSWLGTINKTREYFQVYSWFPADAQQAQAVIDAGGNWFEDSDHIWTNELDIKDTLWTAGPSGSVNNQSVYTDKELWIEGEVSGKQTWCSADTVFVVGDIYYANTDFGEPPDVEDEENPTDMFGLVSEQKILIRYKHTDPETGERLGPNLNNITLYGAYAAIGKGDQQVHGIMACHYDGIFTFQYHHPHGSTPSFIGPSPYTLQDTLYFLPDLHKFIFPPSNFVPDQIDGFNLHGGAPPPGFFMSGYPYESPAYLNSYPNNFPYAFPYGTDYPWYNPVWPESQIDMETIPGGNSQLWYLRRGVLQIFGAIAQRRRGFIHRSGSDPYNHPPGQAGVWDLESYHYDGIHPRVGYEKDYSFDKRFERESPPDFPRIYEGFGEENFVLSGEAWVFKVPPEN